MESFNTDCSEGGCANCSRDDEERVICMQTGLAESLGVTMDEWVENYSLVYRTIWNRGYVDFSVVRELTSSAVKFMRELDIAAEEWIESHLEAFLAYHRTERLDLGRDPEAVPKKVIRIMEIPPSANGYDEVFA